MGELCISPLCRECRECLGSCGDSFRRKGHLHRDRNGLVCGRDKVHVGQCWLSWGQEQVGAYGWSRAGPAASPGGLGFSPPRPPGMSYQGCHSAQPHTHLQEPPTCPGQMLPTRDARSPHRTRWGVHTCDISTQGTVRTGPTCRAASAESARGHATCPCTRTHTPRPHTPRPHTQAVTQAHGARRPTGAPSGWGQAVWLALSMPLPLGDSGEP